MLTPEISNEAHVFIRTTSWTSWRKWPDLMNHIFFYMAEHLFMETVFPTGYGLFQQDNAPCHETKMVQEWFEERNNRFEVLTWLLNSPDLCTIEHVRDVLENQVRSCRFRLAT